MQLPGVADQIGEIGATRQPLIELGRHLPAGELLQLPEQVEQPVSLPGGDIVDLPRAAPRQQRQVSLDDVAHIQEIPHRLEVPGFNGSYPDPFGGAQAAGEGGQHEAHVLSGAGVCEGPRDDHAESRAARAFEGGDLRAELAGGVGRAGQYRIALPARSAAALSVNFAGRSQQEDRISLAGEQSLREHLTEAGGSGGIHVPGKPGVFARFTARSQRCEMNDGVPAVALLSASRSHRVRRAELQLPPLDACRLDGSEYRRGPGALAMRAGDAVALGEEAPHQPAAHEAVGAADEQPHRGRRKRSRSAATISFTSAAKSTFGFQSSSAQALRGSAWSTSTSAGRTKAGS